MDRKAFVKHLPIQTRQVFQQKDIWLHRTLHIYLFHRVNGRSNECQERMRMRRRFLMSILYFLFYCVFVVLCTLYCQFLWHVLFITRSIFCYVYMHACMCFLILFAGFRNCFYDLLFTFHIFMTEFSSFFFLFFN